jgi:hypothetical protein
MRYAHLAPGHLRAAVASLDGILGSTDATAELRRKSGTTIESVISAAV